ncbi:MAG: hypothetical protein MK161_12930 [Pirellulales bacterium]|nr:hypothetical protein [Pirellulales bacterium]
MAPSIRQIRTLDLRQPQYFDDQVWPIRVAICLLGTVLCSIVVVQGGFDNPRPWANGWVHLLAVGLVTGLSLWAANLANTKNSRRLRFCFVLSLIAHIGLGIFLYDFKLQFTVKAEEPVKTKPAQPLREIERAKEFVIKSPQTSPVHQEIEKPVATGAPRLQTDPHTKQQTEPKPLPQRDALPETPTAVRPHQVRRQQPQQAVARQAKTPSDRSRRDAPPAALNTPEPETLADNAATPGHIAPTAAPSPSTVQRATATGPKPSVTVSSATGSLQPPVLPKRRPRQHEPSPERPRISIARRQPSPPSLKLAGQIARQEPAVILPSSPSDQARPRMEQTSRSKATSPSIKPLPADAIPDAVATLPSQIIPRQLLNDTLPTLAHDSTRSRERERVALVNPVDTKPITEKLAETTSTRSRKIQTLEPTHVVVSRSMQLEVRMVSPTKSAENSPVNLSKPIRIQPALIVQANSPGLRPDKATGTSSPHKRKLTQVATVGTEPVKDVTSPAAADNHGGGAPLAKPSPATTAGSTMARSATSVATEQIVQHGAAITATVGQLSSTSIPLRQRATTLEGLRSGGGSAEPRRSRGPQPSAPTQTTAPSLATLTRDSSRSASTPTTQSGNLPDTPVGLPQETANTPAEPPSSTNLDNTGSLTATPDQLAASAPEEGPQAQPDSAQSRPTASEQTGLAGGSTVLHTTLRQRPQPLPVLINQPKATGGLLTTPAREIGVADRRAQRQAQLAHTTSSRLLRKRVGHQPAISGKARVPAAAFSQRGHRQEDQPGNYQGGPSAKAEVAIELGLEFLAKLQLAGGQWQFDNLVADGDAATDNTPAVRAEGAATGLALLAFLGAGYDHYDEKYQQIVQNGLEFLIQIQNESGELFPQTGSSNSEVIRFYSHGIASLALCEVYGMTGDERIRQPAQRALDYLHKTQHPERGGWRYVPGVNADLSVTGWQLMALRSGQLSGLAVDNATYDRVRNLLEACREQDNGQARFRYNPWASTTNPRTRHGRKPSTVMTAVGLLGQLYLGQNRNNARIQRGADHLLKNLPEVGSSETPAPTGTLGNPFRDTYYWYYATQVMFHMGGDYWKAWNEQLHPLLIESQTASGPLAGSWHPQQPVPDKWAQYGGRLYVTAMNLLSLEVYYRHLPLYEMTAR